MGKSEETCKIERYAESVLLLASITAELHPLLEDAGIGLEKGLVVFSEKPDGFSMVRQYFTQTGAAVCKNLATMRKIQNNKVGLHIWQVYDKEIEILKFLDEDGFTPAILIHSMIPDFLRDGQNLIILEGSGESWMDTAEVFREFQAAAHQDPQSVQKSIRRFKSSQAYPQHKQGGLLSLALGAAEEAFCDYYREGHDEGQTESLRRHLAQALQALFERAERYLGEWDNLDAVRNAVEMYLDGNRQIRMGHKDSIEGDLAKANQKGEAILWDDTLYYFPENVLKRACGSIFDMVSFLEIKRELHEKGYLCCNRISEGNFTVKKTVVNVYGYGNRQRFLLIKREFFDRDGELTLPERRGEGCMSGWLTESLAK